jgi:hypothetical protein
MEAKTFSETLKHGWEPEEISLHIKAFNSHIGAIRRVKYIVRAKTVTMSIYQSAD